MSLYEDMELIQMLTDALENAEESTEYSKAINDTLEATKASFDDACEALCKCISNENSFILGAKAEKTRLEKGISQSQKKIDSLKNYIQMCMTASGQKKIVAGTYKLSIAKNGGSLPLVLDIDPCQLPDEFKSYEVKPNNAAIRAFLDIGKPCEFAHYGERAESLRIK